MTTQPATPQPPQRYRIACRQKTTGELRWLERKFNSGDFSEFDTEGHAEAQADGLSCDNLEWTFRVIPSDASGNFTLPQEPHPNGEVRVCVKCGKRWWNDGRQFCECGGETSCGAVDPPPASDGLPEADGHGEFMIDGNFHIMKSSQRQAEWHICPLNGDAPELTWADGEINRTVRYFPTPHAALSAIREWQRREPMNEVLP